ncbi:hypothetical protein QZM35_34405 [Burkholderia sp. AU45274]|uniref:hypothetical protein n=1 Tax=Burkholderia sp. AU45274 TaxID=3059205 RepID=UPI00264AEC76|nr:hypothetical protein [Burkholderia sp. AU45274]MDN7492821.1 hypothetical protein [Burkholderia sp. AU45274]
MTNAHLLDMDAILSVPGFFDFLGDLDCDRALDSRDAEPFDAQWMASFDEVDGDPGTAVDQQAVSALTEKAFKLAFGAAGDAGAVACVSDDIELIARSGLSGCTDGWPTHVLWNAYRSGRFPCEAFCRPVFPIGCGVVHAARLQVHSIHRPIPPQAPDCQTM